MNQASPLYMLHAAKFLNLKPINLSGWYWYWQSLPFKSEGSRFSRLHISTIKTIWRRLLRQPRCLCLSQKNVSVERKIPEKATRKINQKKIKRISSKTIHVAARVSMMQTEISNFREHFFACILNHFWNWTLNRDT